MPSSRRNSVCKESNQKGDTNEKGKTCSNDNEGSFLLLLFEIEISLNIVVAIIPILCKVIAVTDHCILEDLPA